MLQRTSQLFIIGLLVCLTGCADSPQKQETGASDTEASDTEASDTEAGDTEAGDTSDTEASDTTNGSAGEAASIEESCVEICEARRECSQDGGSSIEECISTCIEESSPLVPSADCDAVFSEYSACLSSSACEPLPCETEWAVYEELCAPPSLCFFDEGGVIPNCGIYAQCIRPDRFIDLWCEGDECVCIEDGTAEFASCAANEICDEEINREVLMEKIESCCGLEHYVEI